MRRSNGSAIAAIVPAAGMGRRFGGAGRKLFAAVGGVPLLARTLQALQAAPSVRWIQVVVRGPERGSIERLMARYRITKALAPCTGGASRAESVAKGFRALPAGAQWVLVHDGARPCVSARVIRASVQAARRRQAVACGVPSPVTIKEAGAGGRVRRTLNRRRLWLVQTPQVFSRRLFARALARRRGGWGRFPDDAALVEAAGSRVWMVPGDPLNIKVTTRDDLVLAEAILRRRNG